MGTQCLIMQAQIFSSPKSEQFGFSSPKYIFLNLGEAGGQTGPLQESCGLRPRKSCNLIVPTQKKELARLDFQPVWFWLQSSVLDHQRQENLVCGFDPGNDSIADSALAP
jgi:hypothetical protein